MTLKVKNSSNAIVNIKEGNAGVFRIEASLKPKGIYKLKLDGNATYREYVLITVNNVAVGNEFSSDDALEYSEIEVKNVGDEYFWEGKSKHGQKRGTNANQGPGTDTNQAPGSSTNQAPGSSTNQGPGSSTNQGPGTNAEQAPQTSSKSGGLFQWLRNPFKRNTS